MGDRPRRLRMLLARRVTPRAAAEIREELDLYLAMRTEELFEQGIPRPEAEHRARELFGHPDEVLGDCLGVVRRGLATRFMEETVGSIIRDMTYAVRALRRSPRFVAGVVVTLALGIGANSAIFSVLNAVALRPLPVPESDRLFRIWTQYPEQGDLEFPVSPAEYLDYAAESELFETVGAFTTQSRVLTGQGPPRRLAVTFLSESVWSILGGQPLLGRLFDVSEDQPDAAGVVLLSESRWRTTYGADEAVVGTTMTLDGNELTILGVIPDGFFLPGGAPDVFAPLGLARDRIVRRDGHFLTALGRAHEGVTLERIRAEMAVVTERWIGAYDHAHPLDAERLRDDIVGDAGTPLSLLLAAVGCVLLIGCANVAGLMMARTVQRQRDVAIRTALGASRSQIARQLLIEGLLLAGVGGILGLILAAGGLPALLRLEPGDLPRLQEVGVDARVLAFTLAISLASGLLFALVPAVRLASSDPSAGLAGGGRSAGDLSRHRFLRGLLVAEIAAALVLVVGAGLLTRSFARILDVDPGLQPAGVLTARVTLPSAAYSDPDQIRQFFESLRTALAVVPGVVDVGGVRSLPLAEGAYMEQFLKEGEGDDDAGRRFEYQMITDGYFEAAGIELVAGRRFGADDTIDAPRVAIVNEALVRQHFPGEDPVGARIRILASRPNTETFEIVGVARDVLQDGLDTHAPVQIYVPHRQAVRYATFASQSLVMTLRTDRAAPALGESIERAVWKLDPDLAVTRIESLESILWDSVARPRFLALLLGLLAALALLLAAIGVYSVVSYGVAQRTREFGIRMALGARPGEVARMVLGQNLRPALVGLALGVVVALLAGRALAALLFQTSARDPLTLAAVGAFMLVVTAAAAWLPARRVTGLHAASALADD